MKKVIALACLSMLPFTYVAAEGYQVNAQSAKQAGMGHVGAAMKLGAESMHFNPAGLGFLEKKVDLSAGISGVFASAEYSKGEYKHKSDNDPSTPMYLYAGFKIYDFLSAGVSLTNPYGSAMNWGADWRGSYLVQDIALKSFSIQPTVSWKIMDRLSVGAGMMIMFGDFSLSRAFVSSQELGMLGTMVPALKPLADKYKDITPISVSLSGKSDLKLGYNLGAMFDVTDQITVGVSYRSKVNMSVSEGSAVVSYANESELKPVLGDKVPPFDKGYFKAALPLPSNWNVGVSYKPNDRWLVSGEIQFVGWGTYKSLAVDFYPRAELGKYDQNPLKNYKNTRIYRVGTQFAATNRLDVRLGAYFDESPVKDDYLNPETPSMNKLGLTTGLSFRPLENFSIDLAFSYVTGFGRDGSYEDLSPILPEPYNKRKFEGHYDVHAFTPTIGLSYAF